MADATLGAPERTGGAPITKAERRLRVTAVVFAVALVVHGADHLRRGIDVVTDVVRGAGATQAVLVALTVVLVFRRHRLAPLVAVIVGLISAVGFGASHLLPQWSAFSDPFTGTAVAPGVTAFSWFAAAFEIAAGLAFAVAGLQLLKEE
jgi:hypothetical protein